MSLSSQALTRVLYERILEYVVSLKARFYNWNMND